MKSRIAAVALSATAALSLAACGSGGTKPAAATQAAPANFCDALKATDGHLSDGDRQIRLNQAYALAPVDLQNDMLILSEYAGVNLSGLSSNQMGQVAAATQEVYAWRQANCGS